MPVTDLSDAVRPLIRTRAELYRWSAPTLRDVRCARPNALLAGVGLIAVPLRAVSRQNVQPR